MFPYPSRTSSGLSNMKLIRTRMANIPRSRSDRWELIKSIQFDRRRADMRLRGIESGDSLVSAANEINPIRCCMQWMSVCGKCDQHPAHDTHFAHTLKLEIEVDCYRIWKSHKLRRWRSDCVDDIITCSHLISLWIIYACIECKCVATQNSKRHKFDACRPSRYVRARSVNDGVYDAATALTIISIRHRKTDMLSVSSTNPNAGKIFVYFNVIRDTDGLLMQTNLRSLHCDGEVKWPQVMENSSPFQIGEISWIMQ